MKNLFKKVNMDKVTKCRKLKLKPQVKGALIGGFIAISIIGFGVHTVFSAIDKYFGASHEDVLSSEQVDDLGLYFKDEQDGKVVVQTVWDDEKVLATLHKMSHQKVLADNKWGAIKITPERLKTISKIIDQRKGGLANYEIYREILDKWIDGDFAHADDDHNVIWELQYGTIGRAYGILTPEEEQDFINDVFEY